MFILFSSLITSHCQINVAEESTPPTPRCYFTKHIHASIGYHISLCQHDFSSVSSLSIRCFHYLPQFLPFSYVSTIFVVFRDVSSCFIMCHHLSSSIIIFMIFSSSHHVSSFIMSHYFSLSYLSYFIVVMLSSFFIIYIMFPYLHCYVSPFSIFINISMLLSSCSSRF